VQAQLDLAQQPWQEVSGAADRGSGTGAAPSPPCRAGGVWWPGARRRVPMGAGVRGEPLVAGRAHPRRTGRRMPRAPQPSSCFSSSTDAPPDEDHEASREVTEKSQYPDARTDSPIGSLPRSERAHSTSVSHGGSRHLNLLPCSLQPLPERNTSPAHGNTWPDKNNGHGLTSFNPKGATSPEGVIRSSGMRVGPTTKEYRRVGDLSVNHRTS
jgi:hypothetical protein